MKNKILFLSLVSLVAITTTPIANAQIDGINYEAVLQYGTPILIIKRNYTSLADESTLQKVGGQNVFTQNTNAKGATFYSNDAEKYLATEAVKVNGKVSRLNQARKDKTNKYYNFESVSINDTSGNVDSYSICTVDTTKPKESDCQTITPAVCDALIANSVNEAQLNKDLESCNKLENTLKSLKEAVKKAAVVEEENLKAMNASEIRKHILADASVARKPMVATPEADKSRVQQIQDIVALNKGCARLKPYFPASAAVPGSAVPAATKVGN